MGYDADGHINSFKMSDEVRDKLDCYAYNKLYFADIGDEIHIRRIWDKVSGWQKIKLFEVYKSNILNLHEVNYAIDWHNKYDFSKPDPSSCSDRLLICQCPNPEVNKL